MQRLALDKPHDEKRPPVVNAEIVGSDNVIVFELGTGLGLALETKVGFLVCKLVREQDFHRHDPVQAGISGFINFAHTALTQRLQDLEIQIDLGPFRFRHSQQGIKATENSNGYQAARARRHGCRRAFPG